MLEMRGLLKRNQVNMFTGILLSLILLPVMPPFPNIISANPDEASFMTYGSCILIIPRGTMADNVVWKYVNNTQPECGWNVNLGYDDSKWLEGKSPIGPARYFVRTNVSLREICLRKSFQIQDVPRNAFLNIAVYGDIDVWINGVKVLSSTDSLQDAFYWNHRLNITEHINEGKNLLAIRIKNNAGEAYFDCELPVDYKSLDERVEEFVKGRQKTDGSFYEEYHYDYPLVTIFYTTSILKTLGKMNLLDKNKIMERLMSFRTVKGDFGAGAYNWLMLQYFSVEILKNIEVTLTSFDAEYLARKILQRYWTESHRQYDLSYTYYTLKALESLNALSEIENASNIIKTILTFQGSDGLFLQPGKCSV